MHFLSPKIEDSAENVPQITVSIISELLSPLFPLDRTVGQSLSDGAFSIRSSRAQTTSFASAGGTV